MSIEINKKKELQYLEQVAKLSTYTTEPSRHFNCTCCDDDDYEESTIPLNEIDFSNTYVRTNHTVYRLWSPRTLSSWGMRNLALFLKRNTDEFIKSSVEELVPIPSESRGILVESERDCNLTSCDDFSPINVYKEQSVTFSNPLFDSNDDFTSSDDESLSDEDVPEDNFKNLLEPSFRIR
ncbi:hypothetical protein Tco_0276469 [Tanacetum coccineum]